MSEAPSPPVDRERLRAALASTEDERHDWNDGNCLDTDEELKVLADAYDRG